MVKILALIGSSSNKGSGKSVHVHRLARAFAAHIHKVWMQMKTQRDHKLDLAPLDMLAWTFIRSIYAKSTNLCCYMMPIKDLLWLHWL